MSETPGDAVDGDEMPASPEPVLRHGVAVSTSRGQEVLHPDRDSWVSVARALFDEGYLVAVDLTAVDYLTHPGRQLPDGVTPERFEVVASLLSHSLRSRVRLRVQIPADDPVLATLTHIFPGVDASEREVFDLFGITFDGHPDMTRIVMPEDWVGHPLRKDYDSGRIPVQFKGPAPSR
jgi:NADH-quinone oxidoreductase subunit C